MQRLEQCLQKFDESPSTLKDTVMAFGSNMAAMGHAMAGDEVLKNAYANSALEHYEIAAYTSLMTLGDTVGADTSLLQQSLREEEAMADWADRHIKPITQQFVQHEARAAA
jgi:ferritin-like metal-binding protein YciE